MITSRTAEWFKTKVRFEKMGEDGMLKKVTENYVVDALSHTEAEEKITEEMSSFVSGEFEVKGIVPAPFKEIFFSDDPKDDRWYQAKVAYITFDENTEKEKRSNHTFLVQAGTLEGAVVNIKEVFGGTMIDYVIVSVAETNFWDVFTYKAKASDDGIVDGKMKAAGE